jgi:hypothetical protein
MRVAAVVVMLLGCTSVSGAQTTFVSGSLTGEIARFSFVTVDPSPYVFPYELSSDGEALGFGVSVARALGERWGVALEFVRAGTMIRDDRRDLSFPNAFFPPLPPAIFERRLEQQRLSWNTTAWFSQEVGTRVDLTFLAGASFTRTNYRDNSIFLVSGLVPAIPSQFLPPPVTRTTEYGVDPVVGMDAGFRLTDHLAIVAGARMQTGGIAARRGWLLRPSVGARWGF